MVDDADFEWLSQYKWHSHSVGYAATTISGRLVLMHRLIMETPEGMDTDHINRDKSDNQRANLRVCTHAENMKNRSSEYKKYKNNKSGTPGVSWDTRRGAWVVQIQLNNKRKQYGFFADLKEAIATAKLIRKKV